MRAFVAVEVHNEAVLNSISKLQSDFEIKAIPVSKQNMHFTLVFLGEISEQTAENVKKALSTVSFKPIKVSFTHVGAFPNPKFPRVIWLGTDETSAKQLVELAAQVEQKLTPIGFKADKPFRPHLTIFRIKHKVNDISTKLEKFKLTELGTDVVSELKFKQSVLTPSGPIYSDLQVVNAQ